MRVMWLLAWLIAAPVWADGERAGTFDYYVLSLSWTPSWCLLEGDDRGDGRCQEDSGHGFLLHGLWPQFEKGWPSYCEGGKADPSRAAVSSMAGVMGSDWLAEHQWRKHGRCTGLSADDYFALSRAAYESIARSEVLRAVDRVLEVDPLVVEAALLEANPDLTANGITITCREGRLQEARICLTRSLEPRRCGPDVIRDCGASAIDLPPIR